MQRIKAGSYSRDTPEWQCISDDAKKLVQGISSSVFCLFPSHKLAFRLFVLSGFVSPAHLCAFLDRCRLSFWRFETGVGCIMKH